MNSPVTLVTGAGSGIGRAVALHSAAAGSSVAVLDLDLEAAERVASEARALGGSATAIGCDVRDEAAVSDAFQQTVDMLGTPTRVHANAGIEVNRPVHEMSLADWQRTLEVNLTGAFLTCRAAVRDLLRAQTGGSIVCTSSPSAFVGFAGGGNSAYASSKGGITAFVRSMALEYAGVGIRVNAVIPGATDTPMLRPTSDNPQAESDAQLLDLAASQIPLGRLARPGEIAEAVAWLFSDASSYVTGSQLVCDGGLMAKSANTI
jgi:NAD(P)-dependent dehydrogenase (short-subunit alcohol dehydrogenase family)